jgi:hypothetical protein
MEFIPCLLNENASLRKRDYDKPDQLKERNPSRIRFLLKRVAGKGGRFI